MRTVYFILLIFYYFYLIWYHTSKVYVDTRTIGLKEFSCMTLFQIHLMAFPKTWICIKERFEELYGWNWNIVTGSGMFAHSNVLIIINCVIKHVGSMFSSFIEKKKIYCRIKQLVRVIFQMDNLIYSKVHICRWYKKKIKNNYLVKMFKI